MISPDVVLSAGEYGAISNALDAIAVTMKSIREISGATDSIAFLVADRVETRLDECVRELQTLRQRSTVRL